MADARIDELKQLLPQCLLPDWVRLGSRLVRLLRDNHHPDRHDALIDRLLTQVRASVALREQRRLRVPQVGYPPDLPITARKDDLIAAIRAHQVVVVAGETGSGKTTQIPKMCLEAGLGIEAKIGCTQPRRVAALSISRRIAEELNVAWGREVGCKIRFDDRSSPETYIKLMTDGILLAETQGDPLLSEYNALIIDEAHERSLNIDFLLGYLKSLLIKRTDLKLIITSATIDTEAFSRAFDSAPILEVSGRLYPVEVAYAPFDAASEESGDMTYIDAAVQAVDQVMMDGNGGDVLVFMPGERDIRETRDQLEGRHGQSAEIIPLFGRLSAGEQQRVFAPSPRRKIIVATNIAETSLTIPGIRYVIDTGLARISRYNPRTRTKRLPVEPISQSSANQRKGRAGRVQDGFCIRLYAEEDFEARPAFTQPEIQRANLAEVILRMKAFHLGEIETFAFVNPPTPAAIQNGYTLLQELGALDEQRELTPLGRDLARLPIDPTLGRMLLQSQQEHATRELLIIAAGLSIQDPRERPLDRQEAASAAHRRFLDPKSDFLTLLNIWNAFHDQWETLRTQNQRRKFCKAHFLSYLRMREWQDLHAQLHDALEELGTVWLNESNAAYDAIHRSILTGLLGHVANRSDRNVYKAAGNRLVKVFPGSALFDRVEKKPKKKDNTAASDAAESKKKSSHQPAWLVAGEIVETSQLFARTLGGIEPGWIVQLAPHLCRFTHHSPNWDAAAGRVLANEKVMLHGLEVLQRKVDYGTINPREATEIFIRSALVEEPSDDADEEQPAPSPEPPPERRRSKDQRRGRSREASQSNRALRRRSALPSYPFLEHNRQVRHKIETWQTRVRRHDLPDLDRTLCDFYARQFGDQTISSVHDLNRFLREHPEADFLRVTETDLTGGHELTYDAEAFPDIVPLGGQPVALSYVYDPGEEKDGVTVRLPWAVAQTVAPASVEWAVPGLRADQAAELLRALPKSIRRELMPFPPKVAEIVRDFKPEGDSLLQDLARFIHQRYGVRIEPGQWTPEALPAHLRPRVEIVDHGQKTLAAGRDLEELRRGLAAAAANSKSPIEPTSDSPAWTRAVQQWERFDLRGWTFGDLPERVLVEEKEGIEIFAWPGLSLEDGNVCLRLFRGRDAARRASLAGIRRLVELAVQRDLAWLEKDLRALARYHPLYLTIGPVEELQTTALENIKRHVLPQELFSALRTANFETAVATARERLQRLAMPFIDQVGTILETRQTVLRRCGPGSGSTSAAPRPATLTDLKQLGALVLPSQSTPPPNPSPTTSTSAYGYPGMAEDLERLLPARFLEVIPFAELRHIPRYLKAMLTRADRARLNPAKDQERARMVEPYVEAWRRLQAAPPKFAQGRGLMEEFRWMIEEYKVSLFAQELGTAFPISPKRLDQQLERIRQEPGCEGMI